MSKFISVFVLLYLRLLARLQLVKLRLLNPRLITIGVTGSAGKSSTVAAITAALTPNLRVFSTGTANSESGIPLSLLGVKVDQYRPLDWLYYSFLALLHLFTYWPRYDVLVVEMGIDSPHFPKNMDFLLSILVPDIGVLLNVSPVHLMNFTNFPQLIAEKAKLVNATPISLINPEFQKFVTHPHPEAISPAKVGYHQPLPTIYHHSFGVALHLAQHLRIDQDTATNNIQANFVLPPGRTTILKGIRGSQLIDSSYNSSPLACLEMLKFLQSLKSPRVAVLGDMRELGPATASEHKKIYQTATKMADLLISVGPETSKYFGPKAIKFTFWWQAADYLQEHLPPHSHVLIKGSQNTIFLEELVKSLLSDPTDQSRLCRQSTHWLGVKMSFNEQKAP